MEDVLLQIYGTFILTLAGFVLPIIAIAVSAFPEGVKLLRQTYENEQKQAEENLAVELQKQKSQKGVDYDVLTKNIATLKSSKKKSQKHLLYLNPEYILSRSALAIALSFVSFLLGVIFYNNSISIYIFYIRGNLFAFAISILSLMWAMIVFYNSIKIIIEASSAVQEIRRATEEKTLELLTAIADNGKKGDTSLFIDSKYIHIFFNDEEVKAGKEYTFSINNKHTIKIALKNLSEYMLKTAELGFTFPSEFLIEGSTISSIYSGDKEKIIRFKHDYLQCNVNQTEGSVDTTFLKTGVFDVDTFVKGENLKNKTIKFKIKVID